MSIDVSVHGNIAGCRRIPVIARHVVIGGVPILHRITAGRRHRVVVDVRVEGRAAGCSRVLKVIAGRALQSYHQNS